MSHRKDVLEERAIVLLRQGLDRDQTDNDAPRLGVRKVKEAVAILEKRRR